MLINDEFIPITTDDKPAEKQDPLVESVVVPSSIGTAVPATPPKWHGNGKRMARKQTPARRNAMKKEAREKKQILKTKITT